MKKFIKFTLLTGTLSLFILIALLWFMRSEFFIKKIVLPQISAAAGIDLAVDRVNLNPFKSVTISGLTVGNAQTPLMKGQEMEVRFRFQSALFGNIVIEEIKCANLQVHVIQDADGNLNLPPTKRTTSPTASVSSAPLPFKSLMIKQISLTNLALIFERRGADGQSLTHAQIANINVTAQDISHDQPATFTISSSLSVQDSSTPQPVALTADLIQAEISSKLGADFLPEFVSITAKIDKTSGHAGPIDLANRSIELQTKVVRHGDEYQIENFQVSESLHNIKEFLTQIDGRIKPAPLTADINIVFTLIKSTPLNIIGSLIDDFDFGNTSIRYQGSLHFDQERQRTAITGNLFVKDFTVASENNHIKSIDPLDLSSDHDLVFDLVSQELSLNQFQFSAKSKAKEIVKLELDQPTVIALASTRNDTSQAATLAIKSEHFNLGMIAPLIPDLPAPVVLNKATLSTDLKVGIMNFGRKLTLNGAIDVHDFGLNLDDNETSYIISTSTITATCEDFSTLIFSGVKKIFTNDNELVADSTFKGKFAIPTTANGAPDIDHISGDYDLTQLLIYPTISLLIPPAMKAQLPVKNINAKISAQAAIKSLNDITLKGSITADKMAFIPPDNAAPIPLNTRANLTLVYNGRDAVIREWTINIADNAGTLMDMNLNGKIELTPLIANFDIQIPEITSHAFAVAGRILGDYDFAKTTMAYQGTIRYQDSDSSVALTGALAVKDLSVTSKAEQFHFAQPLNLNSNYTATVTDFNTLTLKSSTLQLTRDKETLLDVSAHGELDSSLKERKSTLNIAIQKPIDAEKLMALVIMGDGKTAKTVPPIPIPGGKSGSPNHTPMDYWLQSNVTAPEIRYKNVIISELNATALLEKEIATINPCTYKLNGGPMDIQGMISLKGGKPGEFHGKINGENVNLIPFISSFLPSITNFTSGGLKRLSLEMKGSGTEWINLKQSLSGTVDAEINDLKFANIRQEISLLLNLIGIRPDDFTLQSALLQADIHNQKVSIPALKITNPQVRMNLKGSMGLGDGWEPDLEMGLAFNNEVALNIEKKGGKLSAGADGFKQIQPVSLQGWSKNYLSTKFIPHLLQKLGLISDQQKAISDVIGSLKGLISGNSTDGQAPVTTQEKLQQLTNGILGTIDSSSGDKNKEQKPADNTGNNLESPSTEKPTEPEPIDKQIQDGIKSIKGLFGK